MATNIFTRYHYGLLCFLLTYVILQGCGVKKERENPVVVIETKFGDIEVELYSKKAPLTVARFLRNIDSGYYRKAAFYRVLTEENQSSESFKSELVQGGIWLKDAGFVNRLPGIPHESTQQTGLEHTNGVISMARTDTGTANTEFFICVGDQHGLDHGGKRNPDGQGFAAFGKVISGMGVVRRIHSQPAIEEDLDPPVDILNIYRE